MYNNNPFFNQYIDPYRSQTIQNISRNIQPQSYCYFVNSPSDLNGINVMPNTFYLGINSDRNEIYMRCMNNDGLIDVKTYSLHSEKKEKTDFQAIFDRLDSIEKKISDISNTPRQTLTLKNKDREEK